jgi:hypothetical protein
MNPCAISENLIVRCNPHLSNTRCPTSCALVRRADASCTSCSAHLLDGGNHSSLHRGSRRLSTTASRDTRYNNWLLQVGMYMSLNICLYCRNLGVEISYWDHRRVDRMVGRAGRADVRKKLSMRGPSGPWFKLAPCILHMAVVAR